MPWAPGAWFIPYPQFCPALASPASPWSPTTLPRQAPTPTQPPHTAARPAFLRLCVQALGGLVTTWDAKCPPSLLSATGYCNQQDAYIRVPGLRRLTLVGAAAGGARALLLVAQQSRLRGQLAACVTPQPCASQVFDPKDRELFAERKPSMVLRNSEEIEAAVAYYVERGVKPLSSSMGAHAPMYVNVRGGVGGCWPAGGAAAERGRVSLPLPASSLASPAGCSHWPFSARPSPRLQATDGGCPWYWEGCVANWEAGVRRWEDALKWAAGEEDKLKWAAAEAASRAGAKRAWRGASEF